MMRKTARTLSVFLISLWLAGPAHAEDQNTAADSLAGPEEMAQQNSYAPQDQYSDSANSQDNMMDSDNGYSSDPNEQDSSMNDPQGDNAEDSAANNTDPNDETSAAPAADSSAPTASTAQSAPLSTTGVQSTQPNAAMGQINNAIQQASQSYALNQQAAKQNMNDYQKYAAAKEWPQANQALQQAQLYSYQAQAQKKAIYKLSDMRKGIMDWQNRMRMRYAAWQNSMRQMWSKTGAQTANRPQRIANRDDDRRRYRDGRDSASSARFSSGAEQAKPQRARFDREQNRERPRPNW